VIADLARQIVMQIQIAYGRLGLYCLGVGPMNSHAAAVRQVAVLTGRKCLCLRTAA
jgi:hypothetical protein